MAPDPTNSRAATRHALLGCVLVSLVHLYILSAGFVWPLPSETAYYNRQADAFAHGQLHLLQKPVAGLLALPDPYDPVANRPFRKAVGVHDAVLYDGKFHLYWGPLPGALLVPVRLMVTTATGGGAVVGDEWLVLAFTLATTLWVSLLVRLLYVRHFADRPPALVGLAVAVYGLATPATYFLARPAVYEAAIVGGQCFLTAGLLALAAGFPRKDGVDRDGPSVRLFTTAGVCLGAAVACRVSLAIGVTAVAAVTVLWLLFHKPVGRPLVFRRARSLAGFTVPLVVTAALLLAYNYARFGRPLEFGQQYQLTGANYKAIPTLFSPANAVPGVWSYAMRPVAVVPTFPFLRARVGEGTFPAGMAMPPNYETFEPIAGIVLTTPVVAFALVALARLLRRDQLAGLRLTVLATAAAGGLGFAPCLFMVGSTQRYLMDLWPALAVLVAVGMFQVLTPGKPRGPRFLAVGALAGWTFAVGLLLGHSGYYDHFRVWNRPWFEALGGVVDDPPAKAG
ncbi:MAG TPA: hypothetical protein VF796_08365 [Humisphaera sp.]